MMSGWIYLINVLIYIKNGLVVLFIRIWLVICAYFKLLIPTGSAVDLYWHLHV